MLVLSRHRDESIRIGDDIIITVVDIRGDKIRLGIEAPKEISVHRQEVYETIQRENDARQRKFGNQCSAGDRPNEDGSGQRNALPEGRPPIARSGQRGGHVEPGESSEASRNAG